MKVFIAVSADNKGRKVPCVGVSLGVERLFAIMEEQAAEAGTQIRQTETQVLVASGQGMDVERLGLCNKLWANDIKAIVSPIALSLRQLSLAGGNAGVER
eukprot:TRINITY_DN9676_c0_g1_i5.p1 TRINITY_DN9676_c0_g1~~TRINITY_DN9676_c0_g1_i5.p1  ORF type:complete len:100 (+),score=27.60 TRINITY_DN9676_c0_g1_i5:120-419(+)